MAYETGENRRNPGAENSKSADKNRELIVPTIEELEAELKRETYRVKYAAILKSTIIVLIVVAAISSIVATVILPVLKIYNSSMSPELDEGDIVMTVRTRRFDRDDVIAFYHNNKIIVRRIVGLPGEKIEIADDGSVSVNGVKLDESYVSNLEKGSYDVEYPFTVPENSYFVLGDERDSSIDSRSSAIGTIESEEIVGKIFFTIWPLNHIGTVN